MRVTNEDGGLESGETHWTSRLRTALLALGLCGLLLAGIAPAWAEVAAAAATDSASEAREKASADDAEDARAEDADKDEPVGVFRGGEVTVQDELPGIPTSNTIATKLPVPLQDTPASVAVVPEVLLREQAAMTVGDALENVAGVAVHTGQGLFDFFTVRGFDSVSSALILTDGASEPESTFYHLYNVERVEVLKGPSAFLYGGGPLAGTLNLVRKQAQGGDFFSVGLSAGSWDTFEGRVDANVANTDGTLAFRANVYAMDTEGYRDGREGEALAINPSLAWRPDDSTSLVLSYERIDNDFAPDSGVPLLFSFQTFELDSVALVPRRRSYQSPVDLSEQEIDRFQVDYERLITPNLTVRDKLYYRGFDWLSETTTLNGAFPGPTGAPEVSRTFLTLDDEQEFVGNQLEILWLGGNDGGVRHELMAGLEVAQLADEFTFGVGLLPSLDLFNPQELITSRDQIFFLPTQARSVDAESTVVAPYVADQIRFANGKVQLLLGLRFDTIDFEDAISGIERDDDELSPLAGLVIAPRDDLSFYVHWAESFAPPSTFALATDQVPEETRQLELGVKKSFAAGRVQTTLAVYDLERENLPIPDSTGILRQIGDQESQGVEFELRANPSARWSLVASAAWTDAELTEFTEFIFFQPPQPPLLVDRSGNTPAFAPELLADLWATRHLPRGFSVAGGVRWVDEQFIDEDNVFVLDDYVKLDAALFWNRGPWRLHLNLENLTDEDYLTRGFGAGSVIPAPGFAASAGFDVRF